MVLRVSAISVWIVLLLPLDWLASEIAGCSLRKAELHSTSRGSLSDLKSDFDANYASDPLLICYGQASSQMVIAVIDRVAAVFEWLLTGGRGTHEVGAPADHVPQDEELGWWVAHKWTSLFIAATIIIQAALISILVHERRQRNLAELESRQRLSQLAFVHRQAIAGQLSSAIAHEINQPLGSILTNAETAELILDSEDKDLSEVKQIIADIRHDVLRASQVIVHMRSLLRRAPFELKTVDMNVLVRDTVELMRPQAAARNVALYLQACDAPLRVEIDSIQLQQVLINLVVNAMDAMAEMPFGRAVVAKAEIFERCALVSIADLGPGIPKESMNSLFEPFVTTKVHGMGIGLSIARTIMHAHKGKIWAENQERGGAIFFLALPLAK